MIVHYIFQCQQSVRGLEVIGQAIIGSIEIEPLVLDACPEIPLTGDEEAMSVAKIIIERVAVTKIASHVVKIAAERVVHLIIEQILTRQKFEKNTSPAVVFIQKSPPKQIRPPK